MRGGRDDRAGPAQKCSVEIALALPSDLDAFVRLAGEVEGLFGPMVGEPEFHDFLRRNTQHRPALVARTVRGASEVAGGVVFSDRHHPTYTVSWLVVSAPHRDRGVGESLLAEGFRRWVRLPCLVELATFGEDHPGARSRSFYERLGFRPQEYVDNGPEGGTRQMFRLQLATLPAWVADPGS